MHALQKDSVSYILRSNSVFPFAGILSNIGESGDAVVHENDPLLMAVLGNPSDEAQESLVADLLAGHAYWRIDGILDQRFASSGLARQHQEDVRAEVILRIVKRLHRLVQEPAAPILDFRAYVAVVTFNTFADFVRRTYPGRARLKNRVLYALRHDKRYSVWRSGSDLLCGYREWVGRLAPVILDHTVASPHSIELREALHELFRDAGGPIEIDAAVSRIAASQFVQSDAFALNADLDAAPQSNPGEELENLQNLRILWSEIRSLPLQHKFALLLGARDATGESVTRYFPLIGIASIRDLAETLELDAEAFGALWPRLPLDDLTIAAMLQLQRQQVINLRRSARNRLERRVKNPRQAIRG